MNLNLKQHKYYDIIMNDAISVGVSIIDNHKIDEINILEASRSAMQEAVRNLKVKPDYIITDAMDLRCDNCLPIIKGDAKSLSIAAASVIAKVTRDHMMIELDNKYPQYGFKSHKGYPTRKHYDALNEYGLIDGYRKTYGPVKKILEGERL